MAHFAKLNENNIVEKVLVFDNDSFCNNLPFPESEEYALPLINSFLSGTWKQTSYNHNFRKHYAGIGWIYVEDGDYFMPPQPYPSWSYDEEINSWIPPVPMPWVGAFTWNEETQSWN